MIRTLLADIPAGELGWCQCHEHLMISDGPSRLINAALCMDDYEKSLAEASLYRLAGGRSIVDAQPYGCARMAEQLCQISRTTGVQIVCCTGFHKTEFMERLDWAQNASAAEIAQIYESELTSGLFGAKGRRMSAKAGIVKCAVVKGGPESNPLYAKLFEAVSNAAFATGAPVMVHFDPDTDAFAILRYFEAKGIKPEKLLLCHLDRTKFDAGYHMELAQSGAYLEYDTIHRHKYHSDEDELWLIEQMAGHGYADRLLLSLDTTRERLKNYGADFGLDDILIRFGPMVEQRLGEDLLHQIMIKNPAQALQMPDKDERK